MRKKEYGASNSHDPDYAGIQASTPAFMGEVAAFAQVLAHSGILNAIQNRVRFARARFGHYDVVDFVAVVIGYAVSGEHG